MKNYEELQATVEKLGGIESISSGLFEQANLIWVRIRFDKDEVGYRSLEFLAWMTSDMGRAGQALTFVPTAGPPHEGEPGTELAYVLQFYVNDMDEANFKANIEFMHTCMNDHYDQCRVK